VKSIFDLVEQDLAVDEDMLRFIESEKRDYFRDESGRFATEGAAGAANQAQSALKDARVAVEQAAKGNGEQLAALSSRMRDSTIKIRDRAKDSLGPDHPVVRATRGVLDNIDRAQRAAAAGSFPEAKQGYERAASDLSRMADTLAKAAAEAEGKMLTKQREYIRDERGRFASSGAAGAANRLTGAQGFLGKTQESIRSGDLEQAKADLAIARENIIRAQDAAEDLSDPETDDEMQSLVDDVNALSQEFDQLENVGPDFEAAKKLDDLLGRVDNQDRLMRRYVRTGFREREQERLRARFERTGYRERERSTPLPDLKPKGMSMKALEDDQTKETADAEFAFSRGSVDDLPDPARAIWQRMYDSTIKIYKGENPERYASALAWRAIREKYRIASDADQVDARPASVAQPLTRRLVSSAKTFLGGVVTGIEGGYYVVPITAFRDVERKYEAIELVDVPLTGAKVRVGISVNNHRNIIDVRVPQDAVSKQLTGNGAVTWVREHWDRIFNIAKFPDEYSPDRGKSVPFPFVTAAKFVRSADRAKHQIVYGPIYTPWKVDLQGQYATDEDVMKMAHGFMPKRKMGQMHGQWTLPDGRPVGDMVESFLVRRGDPDFPDEGAWVGGTKCHNDVWEKVLSGELLGYSIGGNWGARQIILRR
jgi:hypothetical protein